MKRAGKAIAATLIACMMIVLAAPVALAAPVLTPSTITFNVGDTSSAPKQAISGGVWASYSAWELTQSGNAFALYTASGTEYTGNYNSSGEWYNPSLTAKKLPKP